MTVREITRKLRAWEAGRPLPRYATIHHAVVPESDALLVAFVRMAGESRPWGISWGIAGSNPGQSRCRTGVEMTSPPYVQTSPRISSPI